MSLLLGLVGRVTGNPMLLLWIALGAFVAGVVTGGGAAWKVQGWRLDAVKAEFKGFVDTTKALGEAAQKVSDATKAADQKRQEQANEENKRTTDALRADIKRLRNARTSGNFVPPAAPGARRPDLACFDRAELESAIRIFDLEIQGLVDQGSEATVNLDTAKLWAKGTK